MGIGLPAGAKAEAHRLRSGRGLIQQRSIGDRQARELADQGLEIEQGFETSLADFRLVRGVGRVPSRVLKHVALQQRWGVAIVITQANQAAMHLVCCSDLQQLPQGLSFTTTAGQTCCCCGRVEPNALGHDFRDQGIQGAQAQIGQHPLLF